MRKKSRRTKRTRSRTVPRLLGTGLMLSISAVAVAWSFGPAPSLSYDVLAQGRKVIGRVARAAEYLAREAPGYVLDRSYFAVEEIKVFGAERVDRAEIVSGTGLRRGSSIWRIDLRELERRIRQHPWIKRALVRRELPRRVVVEVKEWKPAGIVAFEKLYYVDHEGVIFKAVEEADTVDLPLVTGLRAAGLAPHDGSTQGKLAEVLALAARVEDADLSLSEIRFMPEGGIVLYPAAARVPFAMGWGNWAEKLARLERFLMEWDGQDVHFARVDMSFAGQAVVRLRQTL